MCTKHFIIGIKNKTDEILYEEKAVLLIEHNTRVHWNKQKIFYFFTPKTYFL